MCQILSMKEDGTDVRQLTEDGGHGCSWGPLGNQICYVVGSYSWEYRIWAMNYDGSGAYQVTSQADLSDMCPDWCPDAGLNQIAFSRDSPGAGLRGANDLWVVDLDLPPDDPGRETQLTNEPAIWDATPSWSEQGTEIAFRRSFEDGSGTDGIWVMSRTSPGAAWGEPYLLMADARYPDWCPASAGGPPRIACRAWSQDLGQYAVEVVTLAESDGHFVVDGQPVEFAVDEAGGQYVRPTWSPDGQSLVCEYGKYETVKKEQVWVERVTRFSVDGGTYEYLGEGSYPDWSPNP